MDFEKDVRIDADSLEVEWTRQPELTHKYGLELARARAEADRTKEALALIEAETKAAIRANPAKFGIEKVTEGAINEAVTISDGYRAATADHLKAKADQDIIQAGLNAIYAKKDALENLVRLLGQNYFAAPTVPHNITEEVRKRMEAAKSDTATVRVKEALKSTRRR